MRLNTKQIIDLLDVTESVANEVEENMAAMGLDFSECSQREFNEFAKDAYAFYQANLATA